jgi:predicted MFS family arabinose efflux permease
MSVLFNPAKQAFLPLIVDRKDLAEANAFSSATSAVVNIIGAVLGGIVSAVFSPVTCFIVNSLSFFWSALYVYKIKYQENEKVEEQKTPYLQALKEGFVETKRNNLVRYIILIGLTWGLVGGGYYILIPYLGNNIYHMGGLGIGALYAIDGLGILLGTYFVKKIYQQSYQTGLNQFWCSLCIPIHFFCVVNTNHRFLLWGSMFIFNESLRWSHYSLKYLFGSAGYHR